MSEKKVILVGHCGPDAYMLRSAVRSAVPEAAVEMVNDQDSLKEVGPSSLLLVNRVLDGKFASDSGLDLIASLARNDGPKMMLVSNFEDAQAKAEQAGALPGFGKSDMRSEQTKHKIQAALA